MGVAGLVIAVAVLGSALGDADQPIKLIEGQLSETRLPDGNTVVFEDDEGLVVVDTGRYPEHQAKILAYALERGKPVRAIVNTHWHLDHTGGNRVIRRAYPAARLYGSGAMADALAGVLARALTRHRERIADPTVPEADKVAPRISVAAITDPANMTPDVVVSGPTTLPLGRAGLKLRPAPFGATEADIWVYDPAHRVAVAGDLVVLPGPFFDNGCADGWMRALDAIWASGARTIIPGHGPPLSRREFATYRTAFSAYVACARSALDKSVCGERWVTDAASLLPTAEDKDDAKATVEAYVRFIRDPAKAAELCGPRNGD